MWKGIVNSYVLYRMEKLYWEHLDLMWDSDPTAPPENSIEFIGGSASLVTFNFCGQLLLELEWFTFSLFVYINTVSVNRNVCYCVGVVLLSATDQISGKTSGRIWKLPLLFQESRVSSGAQSAQSNLTQTCVNTNERRGGRRSNLQTFL